MHFSCIHTLSFLSIFFVCDVSLFLPLSLSLSRIDFAWHLSANLLQLETLLVSSLLLIFLHPLFTFGSVMGRPSRTTLRTFRNVAFIWNAMSFCRTFPTLLYPVSFVLGDGILFVRYHWGALLCLYRSFTPTYMDTSVPQFVMTFRGTRIVVTPDLISEVLYVSRVVHPDYPECDRLWIVSRDELLSHFCETHSIWSRKKNTLCSGFAKGLRILNMVMTFVLTPLSHYNSIIEPRAHFVVPLRWSYYWLPYLLHHFHYWCLSAYDDSW